MNETGAGESAVERLHRQDEQIKSLRKFALAVLADWPDDGLDGFELQDLAVECGLLAPHQIEKPCGEGCWCAEYHDDWPVTCYRRTPLLLGPGHGAVWEVKP